MVRPYRSGNEMQTREQVHKQITSHAGTIIAVIPPADGSGDPIRALIVNATNAGANQHLPYLQWDTTKTVVSNWSTAGWGCAPINGTSWISCPFGSFGETFTLNFTSSTPTAQGKNFDCVVPIHTVLNNDSLQPSGSGAVSALVIPKGSYGGAQIDSQLWMYSNNVCLKPAETATITVTADSSQPITLASSVLGKPALQISRATGSAGVLLSVQNIRPAEMNNQATGHLHTNSHPDNDFLLYQAIVPAGGGNVTAPDWTTTANCPNPACSPSFVSFDAIADGSVRLSLEDFLEILSPHGSNCPPVRFKKGTVILPAPLAGTATDKRKSR